MSNILIDKIRIDGFRGLRNFAMDLKSTTVLTGMNNVGKTSILKALQLALGSRYNITLEDFNIHDSIRTSKIIVDVRIVPVDDDGNREVNFNDDWEIYFGSDNLQLDHDGNAMLCLRTTVSVNQTDSSFVFEQKALTAWDEPAGNWRDIATTDYKLKKDNIPFFYIEPQRDIIDDLKSKSSYLGKMLSHIAEEYDEADLEDLEKRIRELNEATINNSATLRDIQTMLGEVDSALDRHDSQVTITPFAKKMRDLNKNMSIQYGDAHDSFPMDYHGMGTRSWSSIMTFKAFLKHNTDVIENSDADSKIYYPVIAFEEPEAHLHSNAQKQLYAQIADMKGQKIIATHSPYIAASANLSEINVIYKNDNQVKCGNLESNNLDAEEQRKLKQKVINTYGEMFFSKAIVLFEGETEDQALPIFAEKYFGKPAFTYGINFISVGGAGQYFPFIYFCLKYNIPWYIFSDGENDTKTKVEKAIQKALNDNTKTLAACPNVFVIANDADFEGMLLNEGYQTEIIQALQNIRGADCIEKYKRQHQTKKVKRAANCPTCNQKWYDDVAVDYTQPAEQGDMLDKMMSLIKTGFGPEIAHLIVDANKPLPALVQSLFNKIKADLQI